MQTLKIALSALVFAVVATHVQAGNHGTKETIIDVAREAGSFSTLLTAMEAAGLTEALNGEGPFTVFAPTDAAVVSADVEASNGVIHVIDTVLIP